MFALVRGPALIGTIVAGIVHPGDWFTDPSGGVGTVAWVDFFDADEGRIGFGFEGEVEVSPDMVLTRMVLR